MNKVLFRAEGIPMPLWKKAAENFVKSVLQTLRFDNWELSVLLCDNRYIKSLNAQYRNKDEATDILSFPIGETDPRGRFLAGDIAISLETLEENARYFKVSVDEELRRLFVHGILHLSGKDHATNGKEEPMLEAQEKILAALASVKIQESVS